MYFNVPKVLDFLLKNGYVYTLRKSRYEGICEVRKRGKKLGIKVKREFVKWVEEPRQIEEFVSGSGFSSLKEWWREAIRQNARPPFRLFKVIVLTQSE